MRLKLERTKYTEAGAFGVLVDDQRDPIAYTLEHTFPEDPSENTGYYDVKLPYGVYKCVRGIHQLAHGKPFETFEVTGVPGHTGILFHIGNTNQDSDGCILLGTLCYQERLYNSRDAFYNFMRFLHDQTEFVLEIV